MTESIQPPPLSPPDPSPAPAALSGPSLVERVDAVRDAVGRAFIGQPEVLDQILIALLAGGHVLIEGVPGLGKTCWYGHWPRRWSWTTDACNSPPT